MLLLATYCCCAGSNRGGEERWLPIRFAQIVSDDLRMIPDRYGRWSFPIKIRIVASLLKLNDLLRAPLACALSIRCCRKAIIESRFSVPKVTPYISAGFVTTDLYFLGAIPS